MKLIGLLITIAIVSVLFVWWMNLSVESTSQAMQATSGIEQSTGSATNSKPVDYSKQKVEEINESTKERGEEVNQLP